MAETFTAYCIQGATDSSTDWAAVDWMPAGTREELEFNWGIGRAMWAGEPLPVVTGLGEPSLQAFPKRMIWPAPRAGAAAWPVQGGKAGLLFGGDFVLSDACLNRDSLNSDSQKQELSSSSSQEREQQPGQGGTRESDDIVTMRSALPPDDMALFNASGWFLLGGRAGWRFESERESDAEGQKGAGLSLAYPSILPY